ncbi:U1 small nuclear ribonucleoprotein 70 kDa-like [Mya arenaria]|uniref:U1 small nuclear ribonucleoprotein 70 kDa-like n=1 Tax=Mya arenaria TaxID=6604 RepID=UPI0022E49094|nr:U1 small nuclear ribonucleoprotein 70 kDa-like [Mya arenaria]XP_052801387.1 U1 small nuclear ribonucleoprotein 70 kDa-like [Mya arenaria]
MTAFLPPNLLALFAARDPIPYLPPNDKLGFEKKRNGYGGVAQYLKEFEDPKDTPPPTRVETKDERKERKRKERAEQIAYKLEQDLALWDPHAANPSTDPYKTLFVARINYDTSESKIRREFEVYGPIRKIKLASDKISESGKPRGYAFIEYEHERDMHSAYKHADGKKIDGRRVLVDVERGRTVKGWRPRRLGGGLGGTRKGGPEENTRYSGRDDYTRGEYRDRDRDRERPERGEREPEPESRERDRPERKRRSRSPKSRDRDRERRRRSRSRDKKREKDGEPVEEEKEKEKDKDKEKDRDRKKRSRRSRSRDRKKRSRSRDRERKRKRSRSGERKPKSEGDQKDQPSDEVGVKVEMEGGDEGYGGGYENGEKKQAEYTEEEGQYEEEGATD